MAGKLRTPEPEEKTMIVLKYLLESLGSLALAAAATFAVLDLVKAYRRNGLDFTQLNWRLPGRIALLGLVPLLAGLSIAVVPAGMAGVRVSQISGTLPDTL